MCSGGESYVPCKMEFSYAGINKYIIECINRINKISGLIEQSLCRLPEGFWEKDSMKPLSSLLQNSSS